VLPADADAAPLTVILAKEGDREEMARRYYRLKSFDAIEESYQKRLKELEDTQQATAVALTKLKQERSQAEGAAKKVSAELAKNQPGQNTELYQQAKRLFVEGKVEEAISLLDEEKLRQLDSKQRRPLKMPFSLGCSRLSFSPCSFDSTTPRKFTFRRLRSPRTVLRQISLMPASART